MMHKHYAAIGAGESGSCNWKTGGLVKDIKRVSCKHCLKYIIRQGRSQDSVVRRARKRLETICFPFKAKL